MNNWIEISGPNLQHNFHALQAAAGPATEVLAVIKANAYGHGAPLCAQHLVAAGAQWLGVTCAEEGVRVRAAAGPAARILVMSGFLPPDVPLLAAHNLTPVVWTTVQLHWLSPHPGLAIHIEVDTGMSRQGVTLAGLPALLSHPGLNVEGLFTHFAASEDTPEAHTLRQQSLFSQAVATALAAGAKPTYIHAGNSSTVDNPTPSPWLVSLAATAGARAMVRTGLALYGYTLPTAHPQVKAALKPVLTWRGRILSVRDVAAGDQIGYSATFTAPHPMRIALLPAGYADGLRRELSSTATGPHAWVIITGQRAPILGRISMNLTVVDITHLPHVQPNDEAILLGPGITAEHHATLAGTIPYEILCGLHPCN